jgi:hypothetical protein
MLRTAFNPSSIDWWEAAASSPAAKVLGAVLYGIVGAVLVAGFLATFLPVEIVAKGLPLVAGFNAMISGFMVVDRARRPPSFPKTTAAGVGAAVGAGTALAVNALGREWMGSILVFPPEAVGIVTMSALLGVPAAMLASWSRKQKEKRG